MTAPTISAARVLNMVREVLAFEGVDDAVKIDTVALLESTDLQSGELTISVDDEAALARATGRRTLAPA